MQITREQAISLGLLNRRRKRIKKPPPPDSYIPHDCVILAIDPGATSGWSIAAPGSPRLESGVVTGGGSMRMQVVLRAQEIAVKAKRPLIVVGETWTTGDRIHDRRMKAATLLGLGAAWARWDDALREARVPRSRILRVNVATWRSKLIGGPMNRSSEEWKRLAALLARKSFEPVARYEPLGDDEAEAICISLWASRAGVVGERVKKAGKRYP